MALQVGDEVGQVSTVLGTGVLAAGSALYCPLTSDHDWTLCGLSGQYAEGRKTGPEML